MEKKNMEIDESLLDDEDGDDITICGRESISSLFIRACGIGPEDVFEDQRCASTPSSTATSAAYKDIASLIQHQAGNLTTGAPPAGRRRINSIIPGQLQSTAPAALSVPGWITGTEAGRADRGRGGRGQRWNRGRGRGNRSYPY